MFWDHRNLPQIDQIGKAGGESAPDGEDAIPDRTQLASGGGDAGTYKDQRGPERGSRTRKGPTPTRMTEEREKKRGRPMTFPLLVSGAGVEPARPFKNSH